MKQPKFDPTNDITTALNQAAIRWVTAWRAGRHEKTAAAFGHISTPMAAAYTAALMADMLDAGERADFVAEMKKAVYTDMRLTGDERVQ